MRLTSFLPFLPFSAVKRAETGNQASEMATADRGLALQRQDKGEGKRDETRQRAWQVEL